VMPAALDAAAPALEPPGVLARFPRMVRNPGQRTIAYRLATEFAENGARRLRVHRHRQCSWPSRASPTHSARPRPPSGPWPRPCSRPSGWPRMTASSAALAASAASGKKHEEGAQSLLVASALASARWVSSTGETSLRATAVAAPWPSWCQGRRTCGLRLRPGAAPFIGARGKRDWIDADSVVDDREGADR
jgi:hypothetical protein